jgi:hypothetical protein
VVHHRGAPDQPGKRRAGLGIAALLGPKRRGLLLGAADEQDPLSAVVAGKVVLGDVVFALAGTEVDQWDVVVVDVAVDAVTNALVIGSISAERRTGTPGGP